MYYVDAAAPAGSTTVYKGVGLPIGFNFTFNGSVVNVFGVNANGWISFGQDSVNLNSSASNTPISATSTASSVLQNRVSALGRNLVGQTGSQLTYATIGTSPNRVLVVEWKKFKRGTTGTADNINFQIRLYESTNVVQFVYGTVTYASTNTSSCEVGLRGQTNTDFNNRTGTLWASTTAGTANNSSVSISSTIVPSSGLTFTYALLQYDAGVSAINSPTGLVAGITNIGVTVKNFASDTLKNASIAWSVNGVLQTPYAWTGNVAFGNTNGPTIIGTYDFTTSGLYTIKTWTENPNGNTDLRNSNDTSIATVYVKDYASLPFSESFNGTWVNFLGTRDVPSVYWSNSAYTGNNSWRRNDDGTSASWTNATTGAYTPTGVGTGTLYSARFHSASVTAGTSGALDAYINFSTVGPKILKFWHINTSGTDTLSVFLSSNGGPFTLIQKFATAAAWTEQLVELGTSTAANSVVRFSVKNLSTTSGTDVGIDSVQVYIKPANEMAAVSWVAPQSGCGHTASDTVTIKVTNMGAAAQTNIPVYYSINGGQTIIGPEYIAGPVNPGDTVQYTFTQHANFLTPGNYSCGAAVSLSTDLNHLNDTIFANIFSVGTISTFPFTENFNTGSSNYFMLSANANAGAIFRDTSGVNNTGCAFMTGFSSSTGWTGTGTISASAAYGTYTTHHAVLEPCNINATGLTHLRMKFDLKQVYNSQKTYTWLVLIANGVDTLSDINGTKYFNPTTASSDPFTTRTFDLSAYANTIFSLEFKSACKYNAANGVPGNNNYIDNIEFFIPPANDAGITSILKPVNKICGIVNDSVNVIVKNYGTDSQINIPVQVDVTTPSGLVTLKDTLEGPLAMNAIDTLFVGYLNTTAEGNYILKAYTDLSADITFNNDTTTTTITTNPILAIPHVEDFQGTPALANWNVTNFLSGTGHGNTSTVMYASMSTTATTASAFMNKKTGPVTNKSYLSFDYRIVGTLGTGTTLTTDTILVLLSDDCGLTYDTLKIINSANHVTSATMKKEILPLASYSGSSVIPGFRVKRGTSGTYYVDIDNVAISEIPVVNLGPDTAFCKNNPVILNAGASASGYTYSYTWSTLLHPASIATTQTISVDSAATYIAVVNNGYGLTSTDTVVVTQFASPVVTLGNDTTVCGSYILNPGTGYSSYTWSTGVHTQTINVTTTGNYWVDVTNAHGCITRDSVHLVIIPLPVVYAGSAQSICYLDSLNLLGSTAANYDSLSWTTNGNGHFIDSTLLHTKYVLGASDITNGTVTLTLTAFADCDTVSSNVVITITTSPSANAGTDTAICFGSYVQLLAVGGGTYSWSPSEGLSDAAIANPVASPTTTTTYVVTVTSSCGSATENVVVTVDHITKPNLGNDATICVGNTVTINAGTGYSSYVWSTTETSHSISVNNTAGSYVIWVAVTSGACTARDTVNVIYDPCVGIEEYKENISMNIIPNPANGIANIVIEGLHSDAILSIFNIQGSVLYSENITNDNSTFVKQMDFTNLPNGIYLVKVTSKNENMIKRLILQ